MKNTFIIGLFVGTIKAINLNQKSIGSFANGMDVDAEMENHSMGYIVEFNED